MDEAPPRAGTTHGNGLKIDVAAEDDHGPPSRSAVGRSHNRLHLGGVDAFGIVYYSHYWDWYQQAFENLLRASGHPLPEILATGQGFPVVHAEIDYRRTLRLGQTVDCELWVTSVGGRSLRLAGQFTDGEGHVLATAATVHVSLARDGGPRDMPEWVHGLTGP